MTYSVELKWTEFIKQENKLSLFMDMLDSKKTKKNTSITISKKSSWRHEIATISTSGLAKRQKDKQPINQCEKIILENI